MGGVRCVRISHLEQGPTRIVRHSDVSDYPLIMTIGAWNWGS